MSRQYKIVMLLDNPYTNDRRVQREAETLAKAGYSICLLCTKAKGVPENEEINGVNIIRVFDQEALFDIKNKHYAKTVATYIISTFPFDILHTHDREMLHVAKYIHQLKTGFKYIHDIHEMHFSFPVIAGSGSLLVKIKSWVVHQLRVWREKSDAANIKDFITVNYSLEENLRKYHHLKKQGIVIRNTPEKIEKIDRQNLIREKFNLPESTKILVFIGSNIYPEVLNLEQVIREIGNKQDLALVFICADNQNKKLVQQWTASHGYKNIFFHPLLKPDEIPTYLASCDVGLVPTWNKKNLSYWYALDNKLFEYMMSEIPILATQQPEYVKMIDKYKIGICVNPDQSNAYYEGLQQILENYAYYKKNIPKAKEENNWEFESKKLLHLYDEVLKN